MDRSSKDADVGAQDHESVAASVRDPVETKLAVFMLNESGQSIPEFWVGHYPGDRNYRPTIYHYENQAAPLANGSKFELPLPITLVSSRDDLWMFYWRSADNKLNGLWDQWFKAEVKADKGSVKLEIQAVEKDFRVWQDNKKIKGARTHILQNTNTKIGATAAAAAPIKKSIPLELENQTGTELEELWLGHYSSKDKKAGVTETIFYADTPIPHPASVTIGNINIIEKSEDHWSVFYKSGGNLYGHEPHFFRNEAPLASDRVMMSINKELQVVLRYKEGSTWTRIGEPRLLKNLTDSSVSPR